LKKWTVGDKINRKGFGIPSPPDTLLIGANMHFSANWRESAVFFF